MHPNAELIENFYTSFQKRDAAGMIACYHDDVQFSDPVFIDLRGSKAKAMWTLLCERGQDLRVEFRDVRADDGKGSAHWDAWYTFSLTGGKVHNSIDATFEFRDGKIVRHVDTFNLHRWAGQALGLKGKLFGGLPSVQGKIRATAMKGLDEFIGSGKA